MGNFDRRGSSRGNFNREPRRSFDGPREMHKATCANCKQECEVPFKPREGSEVFCRECYNKKSPRRF